MGVARIYTPNYIYIHVIKLLIEKYYLFNYKKSSMYFKYNITAQFIIKVLHISIYFISLFIKYNCVTGPLWIGRKYSFHNSSLMGF